MQHRSQKGFSLVSVMVAVGIAGIVAAAVFQTLSNQLSTQKHIELRDELRQVRNLVTERISCAQTLPATVMAGCLGSLDKSGVLPTGPYVVIKDTKGNAVGKLLAGGTQAIGKWHVRARCVKGKTDNALQIATARMDTRGDIMKDPLNKKPLGWMPLFDIESPLGSTLCAEEIIGDTAGPIEAEHLEQKPMEAVSSITGCGGGLLESILSGQGKIFRGVITCPEGKIAVSGGAECMPGAGRPTNIFQAIVGSPKGLMIASRPASNGQAWHVECCLKSGGLLGIGGKFPSPQAYAVCLKDEDKKKKADP